MLALKLAFKNLIGAGLRTWLNVSVLSFAFVVMVFYNGMLDGWNQQAIRDTQTWEVGNGQLWHPQYDPFDPFTIQDAHAPLDNQQNQLAAQGIVAPILIVQASAYPQGRMTNLLLKGIDPAQKVVAIPTAQLNKNDDDIYAIVGQRMAKTLRIKKDDRVLVRWRDANGTFDAHEIVIADVFHANVPTVDQNIFWVPLDKLQQMTGLQNQATIMVVSAGYHGGNMGQWQFKNADYLLKEFKLIITQKKVGSSILYGLLFAIALLAIFDTQVLSIFRRQKEIGTYIALGMTRAQVVGIFTVEGSAHSILALLLAAAYGIPLFTWLHFHGIPMPQMADEMGIAISSSIIPVYSVELLTLSVALVVVSATIVSYFPARKIAKLNPTDALKGKIQ